MVEFATGSDARALQWLEPAQTTGERFLFTQSQPILARTWIPCQDITRGPHTYEATIRVPPELLALMSAENPTERIDRRGLHLRDAAAGAVVPHRAGGRRPRVPSARRARRRLRRAGRRRGRGLGVRRHRADDRSRRASVRAVSVGSLRPARAPAELPVRRHGEPPAHLRDADDPRRRPIAGHAGRARARALLVGQPGDQRDLERHLAQRGFHRLLRDPDRRGALRQGHTPRCCSARDAGTSTGRAGQPRRARHLARARPGRPRPGGGRCPGPLREGLALPAPPRADRRP